jgi:hypothetical protein
MVDAATTAAICAMAATLTSVSISSCISVWIFKAGNEQKRRERLFERGVENHPKLYALLSNLIKQLEFGTLGETSLDKTFQKQRIIDHLKELEPWDSENALILYEHSSHLLYCYRCLLYGLLGMDDNTFESGFNDPKSPHRQELIEKTRELEAAIRFEVGTHAERPIVTLPISRSRQKRKLLKFFTWKRRGETTKGKNDYSSAVIAQMRGMRRA